MDSEDTLSTSSLNLHKHTLIYIYRYICLCVCTVTCNCVYDGHVKKENTSYYKYIPQSLNSEIIVTSNTVLTVH